MIIRLEHAMFNWMCYFFNTQMCMFNKHVTLTHFKWINLVRLITQTTKHVCLTWLNIGSLITLITQHNYARRRNSLEIRPVRWIKKTLISTVFGKLVEEMKTIPNITDQMAFRPKISVQIDLSRKPLACVGCFTHVTLLLGAENCRRETKDHNRDDFRWVINGSFKTTIGLFRIYLSSKGLFWKFSHHVKSFHIRESFIISNSQSKLAYLEYKTLSIDLNCILRN